MLEDRHLEYYLNDEVKASEDKESLLDDINHLPALLASGPSLVFLEVLGLLPVLLLDTALLILGVFQLFQHLIVFILCAYFAMVVALCLSLVIFQLDFILKALNLLLELFKVLVLMEVPLH